MNKDRLITKIKEWINGLPYELRRYGQACVLCGYIILFLLCALIVGALISSIQRIKGVALHPFFYYSLGSSGGFFLTVVAFFILFAISLVITVSENYINTATYTDSRGVTYMLKGTHGTAHPMLDTEAMETFDIGDLKKNHSNEIIFGRLKSSSKFEKTVYYKKGNGIKDVMIIGRPGSGKSWSYVRNNVIQCIKRGESFIVVDPSGELYSSLSNLAKLYGYNIKVMNFFNAEHSDCWNAANEVLDVRTGKLDSKKLNKFADAYVRNAELGTHDAFWYPLTKAALQCSIGATLWKHNTDVMTGYLQIFKGLTGRNYKSVFDANMELFNLKSQHSSVYGARDLIISFAEEHDFDCDEIAKMLNEVNLKARPFSFSAIFNTLLDFENQIKSSEIADATIFDEMPLGDPGHISYVSFKRALDSEKISIGSLQGILNDLQIFSDEKIRTVLSNDGIEFEELRHKKTGYFVIFDPKDNQYKPLIALFFTFLCDDICAVWDLEEQKKENISDKNKLLPITFMLDEFYSCGIIGGDEDFFPTFLSTCRKYQCEIHIIIQNITYLDLYGENGRSTITSPMDYVLFLGTNDHETAEWISKRSGIATALSESHQQSTSMITTSNTMQATMSTTERPLISVSEALEVREEEVLFYTGKTLWLNRVPWTEIPEAKKCTKANYLDDIPSIYERKDQGLLSLDSFDESYKSVKQSTEYSRLKKKAAQIAKEGNAEQIQLDFDKKEDNTEKTTKKKSSKKQKDLEDLSAFFAETSEDQEESDDNEEDIENDLAENSEEDSTEVEEKNKSENDGTDDWRNILVGDKQHD